MENRSAPIESPAADAATDRVVYLMRGLPCAGKSHTARLLSGEAGIVLETDEFFWIRDPGIPPRYHYRQELLPAARQWNFERFQKAIAAGTSPIVVDRGNGRNSASRQYALYAIEHGYRVELREPDSPWWREIRELLRDKVANREKLRRWAERLAEMSLAMHRVPVATIQSWIDAWDANLTVADILAPPPPRERS